MTRIPETLDRSTFNLHQAQAMVDARHSEEYLALDPDARARVDVIAGKIMEKISSLMEGSSPIKAAIRGALKPRYLELRKQIETANLSRREITALLADVWKQTTAILDKAFDSKK